MSESDDANARAERAKRGSPFLNTKQAAFYIGLHRTTLEMMRKHGGGPRFRYHGRFIRYHIDDLDQWSLRNRQTRGERSDA